ncbi:MAG: hypothetical protein CL678_11120 [Bdellovibrionaceae bacterium]|nr:hypothetical protein [Pseudobdellovibrionaceae bacterium]|tara:strand:+ start:2346 stop:3434 length:1089 start_codon:yes stop_codon:yes gene_type:complete
MKIKFFTLLTFLIFSQISFAKHAEFPSQWIHMNSRIEYIEQAPAAIQWQMKQVDHFLPLIKNKNNLIIEGYFVTQSALKKMKNYFIMKGVPKNLIKIKNKNNKELKDWSGWVTVRPENSSLPKTPPRWNLSLIQTSLASPQRNAPDPIKTVEAIENKSLLKTAFRPGIGLQWYNVDTDPTNSKRQHLSWLGLRAEGDVQIFRFSDWKLGAQGHFFSSLTPIAQDALDTSLVETSLGMYLRYTLPPSNVGLFTLSIGTEFYGNWRGTQKENVFLDDVRTLQIRSGVSTTFDEKLILGVDGTYGFTEKGIFGATLFLNHQIFGTQTHPWSFRAALSSQIYRANTQQTTLREMWTSIQIGFKGSI